MRAQQNNATSVSMGLAAAKMLEQVGQPGKCSQIPCNAVLGWGVQGLNLSHQWHRNQRYASCIKGCWPPPPLIGQVVAHHTVCWSVGGQQGDTIVRYHWWRSRSTAFLASQQQAAMQAIPRTCCMAKALTVVAVPPSLLITEVGHAFILQVVLGSSINEALQWAQQEGNLDPAAAQLVKDALVQKDQPFSSK